MQRIIGSTVALAVLTIGTLAAQQPALEAGTRVRIHTAGATTPLTGTVAYRDPGRVAVLRAPADTAFVPFTAITRVEVSTGRRSNFGAGAKWGALVGAGAGALLGLAAMSEDGFFEIGAEAVPIGALAGGFLGGAVGGLLGALTTSERWAPGAAAVALTAGGDRVGVSGRLTF
jgi:hypothetical protein